MLSDNYWHRAGEIAQQLRTLTIKIYYPVHENMPVALQACPIKYILLKLIYFDDLYY